MGYAKDDEGVWRIDGVRSAYLYVEDGRTIMVKITDGTDPVEMNADEARELADLLHKLAEELEGS